MQKLAANCVFDMPTPYAYSMSVWNNTQQKTCITISFKTTSQPINDLNHLVV